MSNVLFFDIESHNAGREVELGPRKFMRLFQYSWGGGPVETTRDYDEAMEILRSAKLVVGHNIISFDLPALFGYDSLEPLHMARDKKVIDTFYVANLLVPAPVAFTKRNGQRVVESTKPVAHVSSWLGLDNLCYQLGLEGKLGDLKELARKYNPPKTKQDDLDYGLIDLDDPDFKAYAGQDVEAVRSLYRYLVQTVKDEGFSGEYVWREMYALSAIVGQMKMNGILVDQEFALGRIETQQKRKQELVERLVKEYDFPTEGKAPWATNAGKQATLRALADYGFTPENTPEWELTPKGAPKLGGEDLLLFTAGTEAEEFVRTLGELKGQRSIPQLVLDSTHVDGRVHPEISALQRSGRFSFSRPGVTVFGDKNERLRQDKAIFRAGPGKVLAGFDYSNADARGMAALSGDHEYALRFAEDEEGNLLYDGHNLSGEAIFTPEIYYEGSNAKENPKPRLRPVAKVYSHASNYGIGAYKLAVQLNTECSKLGINLFFWAPAGKNQDGTPKARPIPVPEEFQHVVKHDTLVTGAQIPDNLFLTKRMLERAAESYPFLARFKEEAYREAEKYGYVTNAWGRRIYVEKSRAYTGGPAAYGQNATSEMMKDAVIRLCERGDYYIRALRAVIHDELLLEFDEETIERDIQVVKECMEVDFDPKTRVGFPIKFPVGVGWGKTWLDAGH